VPLLLDRGNLAGCDGKNRLGVVARSGITERVPESLGCGRVLMGLMRRMYRTIRVRPLEDLASLKALSDPGRAAKA